MKDLAIAFNHHGMSPVALENLESFRVHNPDADIYLSEFGAPDPVLQRLPFFSEITRSNDRAWRNSDLLLYNAFFSRTKEYKKWLAVEWDTRCAIPVAEFFSETWNFDAVSTAVATPSREPEWHWFHQINEMPESLRAHACGMKPFAVSLFSQAALAAIVERLFAEPFEVLSELRIGTLAHAVGALPVPNPRSAHTVSWRPLDPHPFRASIEHPVKHHWEARDLRASAPERTNEARN